MLPGSFKRITWASAPNVLDFLRMVSPSCCARRPPFVTMRTMHAWSGICTGIRTSRLNLFGTHSGLGQKNSDGLPMRI